MSGVDPNGLGPEDLKEGGPEYPGVPPGSGEPPPLAADARTEEERQQEFWERMVATGVFKSVEHARNQLDRRDWKEVERAKRLARGLRGQPAREVAPEHGRVKGRSYRQVNVKLSEPDFAALRALAIDRDVAPATLARYLLRRALNEEAGL